MRHGQDSPLRWDLLPPPTYAGCLAVVRRLPRGVREDLSAKQQDLLVHLLYLSWAEAQRKKRNTACCSPRLAYLAGKCGVAYSTVKRYVEHLRSLDLIRTTWLMFCPGRRGHLRFYCGGQLLSTLYRVLSVSSGAL